jgi:hypothetical protein
MAFFDFFKFCYLGRSFWASTLGGGSDQKTIIQL